LKKDTNPTLKMEIIFPKSLAKLSPWVRFALPNENWALWRVVGDVNSCVIAPPANLFCQDSSGWFKAPSALILK
jgi:hypothetical protein